MAPSMLTHQYIVRLRNNSLFQALVLSLAILVCYYGLWNAYFATLDDFGWTGLMRHRSLSEALQGLGANVRYFNFALIWVKARFFGLNAAPYFWSSLLQHAIVTIIVYRLVEFWTHQRPTAFLAALLFATKFSYFEVVTSISASDYSFWTIFYVLGLALFAVYLKKRALPWYLASVGICTILTFAHDYALTMPLVLLAYHLTVGRGSQKIRSLDWSELRLHVPFWILWGLHVSINLIYVFQGTSEAIYSVQGYGPGLHQITNLFYLIFLLIPNVHAPLIYNFLTFLHVTSSQIEVIWLFSIGLAIVCHLLAIICFWKGLPLLKLALALTYLPFLPYTLWQGDNAGAFRYLYLPSIGFSMLLALLFMRLHDHLRRKEGRGFGLVVPGLVTLLLIANLIVIQIWVQQHIGNSLLRRAFVTQLAADFQDIESGSWIYIEVPQAKYTDLKASCVLVFQQPVNCLAFVNGEISFEVVTKGAHKTQVYWLQATPKGFNQLYPPLSDAP